MKTLGLIGGSSWISTVDYYRYLNQMANHKLGGAGAARLVIWSVNFAEFKLLIESGDPQKVADHLAEIAMKLETAGAEALMICANTPHMHADFIQSKIKIPILHIGDATAIAMKKQNIKTCGLLGTKYTMEQSFMKDVYKKYNIETIVPNPEQIEFINETIFTELGMDIFTHETKSKYLGIMDELRQKGAEGIVLGCTEIPLLIKQSDHVLPLFDTALIHSQYAVDFATS